MRAKLIFFVILGTFLTANAFSQNKTVTLSGLIKDKANKTALPYVNVVLKTEKDSAFVTGTVSDEEGLFTLSNIEPNNYYIEIYFIGYVTKRQSIYVGSLSDFLDLASIEIEEDIKRLKK